MPQRAPGLGEFSARYLGFSVRAGSARRVARAAQHKTEQNLIITPR